MCGIVGLSLYRQNPSPGQEKNFDSLRNLFTGMLLAAQERGSAATGVVLINQGAGAKKPSAHILRAPLCSKDFVQTDEYKELQDKIGPDTLSIIGHTRAVSGSLKQAIDNSNNHPHLCGDVIGVHNGNITNDRDLWRRYRGKLPRHGDCDSEIIFSLLNHKLSYAKSDHDAITRTLVELLGWWAIAAVNMKNPTRVLLAKDFEAPLTVGWLKDQKTAVFASRWEYVQSGMPAEFTDAEQYKFNKNTLIVLDSQVIGGNSKFSFEEKKIIGYPTQRKTTGKICAV